jgi:putative transposase
VLEKSSLADVQFGPLDEGLPMKRSKFTEAQIAFVLRQAEEGTAVGEACRKAGISEATYYNWRKKYVGLTPSEMRPVAGECHMLVALLSQLGLRVDEGPRQSNHR